MAIFITSPPSAPAPFQLEVPVGDDFAFTVDVVGRDLTGYTLASRCRYSSGGSNLWSVTSGSGITVVVELDPITEQPVSTITMRVADTVTDDLPVGVEAAGLVWDLRWTDTDGRIRTILAGPVVTIPSTFVEAA